MVKKSQSNPNAAAFLRDPAVKALRDESAGRLLSAMMRPKLKSRAKVPRGAAKRMGLAAKKQSVSQALASAKRAATKAKDVGLTVSFKKVRILDAKAGGLDWGRGEVFVFTSLLDGSGRTIQHQTRFFEGIHDGDYLPLGSGGMLVGAIENPRWFVDLHMVIGESDQDIRNIGKAVAKARKQSGISKAAKTIGALAKFDPTAVTKMVGAADLFLATLQAILTSNGDDHIATVHDFYLMHQGFGAGRHPKNPKKLQRFQDAQVSYQIDVVDL